MAPIEFRILGPLDVRLGGRDVPLGGRNQRALLALLLLHANRVVSRDQLVDGLWGSDPPPTAHAALRVYLSRLRHVLEDDRQQPLLERRSHGYLLAVGPDQLDAERFERLVQAGREALRRGDAPRAAATLRESLSLWRGGALADLADEHFARPHVRRLEETRIRALEDRIEADLLLGRHLDVVPELEGLIAAHPYRERFAAQLMLAYYRCGRQTDALQSYQVAHRALAELGLEPGEELRLRQRQILAHDEVLRAPLAWGERTDMEGGAFASPAPSPHAEAEPGDDVVNRRGLPSRATRPHHHRSRQLALLAALALAATAVVVGALLAARETPKREPARVVPAANMLIKIDPATNEVLDAIRVGRRPTAVVAADGVAWVLNERDRTIAHVDLRTREVTVIGGLRDVHAMVRASDGGVWVSGFGEPVVVHVDPASLEVDRRIRVASRAEGLSVGGGSLWVTNPATSRAERGTISRIDLRTYEVEAVYRIGTTPTLSAFGYGSVWATNYDDSTVSILRPGVSTPESIRVEGGPLGVAAGAGAVWVATYWNSTVWRIDPETRRVRARIPVASGVLTVAAHRDAVWVTSREGREVTRIDASTNKVASRIRLPVQPWGLDVTDEGVWVTLADADV